MALNPEAETTSQGESMDEALASLHEATELYLEEFSRCNEVKSWITTFEAASAKTSANPR